MMAQGLAAVANSPHRRSNIILLADLWVAQLESDLFLSAHDSVVHARRRAVDL
jgi:hypothetical protein